MWCIKCQADVAAEMAPDNRQILCASCGSRIRTVPLLPTEDKTRQARELLQKWSQERDRTDNESETLPQFSPSAPLKASERESRPPSFRRDEQHESISNAAPRLATGPVHSAGHQSSASRQRTHDPHALAYPPPHFHPEPFSSEANPRENSSSRLQAFWGQILAYAGVLALTIGAAFVLLGYFGGPQWQSYTPTGWLITTTGQMLLFLGVVTLVSGGMEQTAETVAARIDQLGQRIVRIEWASQNHALKGPSIPAEQFAEDAPKPPADSPKKANVAAESTAPSASNNASDSQADET